MIMTVKSFKPSRYFSYWKRIWKSSCAIKDNCSLSKNLVREH